MTPGRDTGSWPRRRSRAVDWLVRESVELRFIDDVFARVCEELCADGLPLDRATLHLRALHPQFVGATIEWRPGMRGAAIRMHDRASLATRGYVESPVRALFEGAEAIRERLDAAGGAPDPRYGVFAELRAEGFVDYVGLPMRFTDGRRHATSWATRRPEGFREEDLAEIRELLPLLAMALEIRLNRRIARILLETYVGARAGRRILDGEITRGSGETVQAAIWYTDLRGFTRLSQTTPLDRLLAILNRYFDIVGDAVTERGGEILKFVGDGVLAIFPLESGEACARAYGAALAACRGMCEWNEERRAYGEAPVGFGLALHVGDVLWGNVGTATRLDFTVVGPAVNVAARLEELSKTLGHEIVLSEAFVGGCGAARGRLVPLGRFRLRDVDRPLEVYTVRESCREGAAPSATRSSTSADAS